MNEKERNLAAYLPSCIACFLEKRDDHAAFLGVSQAGTQIRFAVPRVVMQYPAQALAMIDDMWLKQLAKLTQVRMHEMQDRNEAAIL